ncbi:MAG: hypothetical protein WBQ25_24415 [Nitrososphaeraceae archaeon]
MKDKRYSCKLCGEECPSTQGVSHLDVVHNLPAKLLDNNDFLEFIYREVET